MGTGTLSKKSCDLIRALFNEEKIWRKVTEGINGNGSYKNVHINSATGVITFGKYSWSGFGGFWNRLIKCSDKISFADFAIKTWDALTDMTVGTAAHEAVLEGLSREVLMTAIRKKDYDWIVDRFFDIDRHLATESYWKTQGKAGEKIANSSNRQTVHPSTGDDLIVTVSDRRPVTGLKVIDAVGDVFEVLNVRWAGSRKSVM